MKKATITEKDMINRSVQRYRAVVIVMDIHGQKREQFDYGDTPAEALSAIQHYIDEFVDAGLEIMNIVVRATYEDEYADSCRTIEKNYFALRRVIRDSAAIYALRHKPDELAEENTSKARETAKNQHVRAVTLYKEIASGARRRVDTSTETSQS